jgi:DNA segregation ATPase FtsK/SpoIIIE-like protein
VQEPLQLLPPGDGKSAASGEGAEPDPVEQPSETTPLGTLGDVWPGDEATKPPATAENVFEWLVGQAVEVLRATRRASLATLQRRLRIAFEAAAKVMDELEKRGIVGPARDDGAPREILHLPEAQASATGTGD